MANRHNHRRSGGRNRKRLDRPATARSCAGEGHNGRIGRSKWVRLSHRKVRRAQRVQVQEEHEVRKRFLVMCLRNYMV